MILTLHSPLAAIGDPVRRSILELLRDQPRTAGAIAAQFPVSWPAVSRHLRVLKQAGLIEERRSRRQRIYALKREALQPLVVWLHQLGAEVPVHKTEPRSDRVVMGRQDFS